ncbi:hypothetical protein Tco_0261488 [Tanacetum coccineum]
MEQIDRLLKVFLTSEIRDCALLSVEKQKNELLKDELAKSSSDSKDIQANLLKRIKILENDFKRPQAQSIDFEIKLQHQKERMACDVSWKSKLSTLNDENVLLKTQVDSVVKERENVKLEYQKLFNSIKGMISNNVYFIASFIPYILKINYFDYKYDVSIKEDTAYPCLHSPKTIKETRSIRRIQRRPIRRIEDISIEEVMADMGKKSSMETFAPNDKADYYSEITTITVNGKNAYDLKGKFLDDLHNNAFDGTNGEEAVKHIEYFLRIVDPIDLPNINHDKLRVVVFPISLVDIFTKGALWDYWKMGGDEIKVFDDESSDLKEYWSDKEEETAEIFKIDTYVFYYETPLCLAFNKFNYLLKVDPDLLTNDIMGFKTYEDYKDDWIYEWNKNVPWVYDKPWLDNGIWKEPKLREDGYCNGGNLPGAYHILNSLHYQDLEWYEALEDGELKDKALRNKAIMEGSISDDESSNDGWKRWEIHEITYHDHNEIEYENETHDER